MEYITNMLITQGKTYTSHVLVNKAIGYMDIYDDIIKGYNHHTIKKVTLFPKKTLYIFIFAGVDQELESITIYKCHDDI